MQGLYRVPVGTEMAFMDGSAIAAGNGIQVSEAVSEKPVVAPRDMRRVRVAAGMTLALLMVDVALYLPRFF